jgi:hypothetical protein
MAISVIVQPALLGSGDHEPDRARRRSGSNGRDHGQHPEWAGEYRQ